MESQQGRRLDDLAKKEIELYLNQNKKDVYYTFTGIGNEDAETGITELKFYVQFANKGDDIIIEYSFPNEGGSRFQGHVFHLNLQTPSKLNGSVNSWIQEDITRAEQELMKH